MSMSANSWLKSLVGGKWFERGRVGRKGRCRRLAACRPSVEWLEERNLLATMAQFASGWSSTTPTQWTPMPPSSNVLGPPEAVSMCVGASSQPGQSTASFTFPAFSIPGGSVIQGVEVNVKHETSGTQTIRLTDTGSLVGATRTLGPNIGPSTCDGTSFQSVGGPADLWGLSLTPADFNAGDIGFRLIQDLTTVGSDPGSLPIDIDAVQLIVHYGPANSPPIADAGGPYSVPEGGSVGLTGAGSSDPDQSTASLTFEWDLDNDGAYDDAVGINPTFSAAGLDGLSTRTIGLRVTDSGGLSDTDTTTVQIQNVPPTIALNGAPMVDEGTPYNLTLGPITDPGIDTVTSIIVHWGDGLTDTYGAPGVVSHTYDDGPDNPTIVVDLIDEDGTYLAVASLSLTVKNVAPVAILGNDGPVDEGSPANVAFSGQSDPSTDDAASLRYAYDFGADGTFELGDGTYSGSVPATSAAVPAALLADGPALVPVKGRIIDNDGGFTDYTTTVVVENVPPTLIISGAPMVDEGSTYTLNLSSSDPGLDTISQWDIDWGDGHVQTVPGDPSSVTHVYADGTQVYQITATATDEDGTYAAQSQQAAVNNGTLDPTFDGDGIAIETLPGGAGGRGVTIQPDGKILVATQIRGGGSPSDTDLALLRFDTDGSLDLTFGGGDGIATADFSPRDRGEDVVLLSSGQIAVAGTEGDGLFGDNFALAIFDAAGGLVSQTSSDLSGSIDRAFGVTADAADNIYVVGRVRNANDDAAVARYTPAGALDVAWGTGGVTAVDFFGQFDIFNDVAVAPGGKIVAAGYAFPGAPNRSAVARLDAATGSLDTSFDVDGKQTTFLVTSGQGVAVQPDGKILVAGNRGSNFGLIRFESGGAPDASFGTGGALPVSFGTASSGTSVALDAAGRIVVAGGVGGATDQDFGLARLDASGVLDGSFGTGGLVRTDFTASPFVSNERIFEIAIAANGQIVAAGQFLNVLNPTSVAVARYGSPGGISDAPLDVLVKNVAPSASDPVNSAAECGDTAVHEPVTVTVDFSDPGFDNPAGGTAEDFTTSSIDWGDGNVETVPDITVTESPGSAGVLTTGTVAGSHTYTMGGIYTITVTVRDDDGGQAVVTTTAFITGVGLDPVSGHLEIVGTRQADHVTINRQGNGFIKVHADFLPGGNFVTFPTSAVTKIVAYLCDGDDHFTAAGNLDKPALVHGGAGDDHLNAGGGPTVLLGDAGDDMLVGGNQRDLLIGGLGRDRLVGGGGDDVLIGGSTDHDDDDSQLMNVLAAWTSGGSYSARVLAVDALLTVTDDEEEDLLTGSSGRDLFYDGLGDTLNDVKTRKDPETVL